MTINALADELVMDRTTLGRNILPLERDGLISVAPGRTDRRSRELQLTDAGIERLQAARSGWSEAQTHFAAAFGRRAHRQAARFARRGFSDRSPRRVPHGWLNRAIRNDRSDTAQLEFVGPNRRMYALLALPWSLGEVRRQS